MNAAGDLVKASRLYCEALKALCTLPQEDNPNDQELLDEVGAAREALALIQSNLAAPAFHACPGSAIEVSVIGYRLL